MKMVVKGKNVFQTCLDEKHGMTLRAFSGSWVTFDDFIETFSAYCFPLCKVRRWAYLHIGFRVSGAVLWQVRIPLSYCGIKQILGVLTCLKVIFFPCCVEYWIQSLVRAVSLAPTFLWNSWLFKFFQWGLHPGPCACLGMCLTTEFHPSPVCIFFSFNFNTGTCCNPGRLQTSDSPTSAFWLAGTQYSIKIDYDIRVKIILVKWSLLILILEI